MIEFALGTIGNLLNSILNGITDVSGLIQNALNLIQTIIGNVNDAIDNAIQDGKDVATCLNETNAFKNASNEIEGALDKCIAEFNKTKEKSKSLTEILEEAGEKLKKIREERKKCGLNLFCITGCILRATVIFATTALQTAIGVLHNLLTTVLGTTGAIATCIDNVLSGKLKALTIVGNATIECIKGLD